MNTRICCVGLAALLLLGACGRSDESFLTPTGDLSTPHDLAGRDLASHDLAGRDLAGRDLAGRDLAGADLAGADLSTRDGAPPLDLAGRDLSSSGVDLMSRDGAVPVDLAGRDLATLPDLSVPRDGGVALDLATRDLSVPRDLSAPVVDLGHPVDMSGPCSAENPCPNGESCDWLNGQCVPTQSCTADNNCPGGDACIAGVCLPVQFCLPLPIPGFQCGAGQQCQFPPGACVPVANCGSQGPCSAPGETCVSGYCEPTSCTGASDCNDGYLCLGGRCSVPRYCGFLDPCPAPQRCQAHICTTAP